MLNNRQTELLKLIVEAYIKEAKPVSSKSICKKMRCSSATIRNEMAFLEEKSLIEKTHTSSGRIPSEKGYRYYVDNVMKPKELSGEDVLKLQTIFRNNSLVLEDYIIKSMQIVSEMTNYTTVVLGKASKENKISKIEVVPIDEQNLVAIVVTDKGHVEHRNIYLNERVSINEIKKTIDLISKLVVGTPVDEVNQKLEFEVKPIIAKYIKQHEVLYNAFYNAFSDFSLSSVKMSGAKNILMQPEFDDADRIRNIINKFEDKDIINGIVEEDSGINIYIGSETEFDDDVTIVKSKYNINGQEGTIALIGPKRMEYDRVVTLLEYIKENIEK
ncbi:MAG: heat-inducible transcriptional repressor HrcA [Bacilli bacterium]|nr:heat-inducible transcriptional repressor HrcA [Bacilli bacterium]MDD4733628.1 heat-inducible transcriptional repressor HrcA [Bacilli bacterium]